MPKIDRENLYKLNIYNIKEKSFIEIINESQELQSFNIDFTNRKLSKLFKIISKYLEARPFYSFSDYIDSIFLNLSFYPGLELLLKYQFYSLLQTYYLNPINATLYFSEDDILISSNSSKIKL